MALRKRPHPEEPAKRASRRTHDRSPGRLLGLAALCAASLVAFAHASHAADHIKIGVVRSLGGAPVYVAAAKDYFAAEGLDAELVFFDSAQPVSVAVAGGDVNFGTTGLTAAFFNLASQGALRIISSSTWETPGFQNSGFLVSNQAYAAGLHAFKDLKGHSVGITQRGTPLEYDLARIVKKYAIPQDAVKILALQSNQNIASALKGGEIDVGVQTVGNVYPLVARGDAKLLGWVADEMGPGQSTVTFTRGKLAAENPDLVRRFLAAFAKGSATWDAAFIDPEGERQNQPSADEMIAIVAKALDQPPDVIARGIGYFDPQNRIVLANIQDVLDWYLEQGMIKTHIDAKALLDERFVLLTK